MQQAGIGPDAVEGRVRHEVFEQQDGNRPAKPLLRLRGELGRAIGGRDVEAEREQGRTVLPAAAAEFEHLAAGRQQLGEALQPRLAEFAVTSGIDLRFGRVEAERVRVAFAHM